MERATPSRPLTPMQLAIAGLAGVNLSHAQIATELHITVGTVRYHINRAAKKLPGDLPAEQRVVAWMRGATLDVLEGRSLRFEMMRDAQQSVVASQVPTV